ncbi:MAG TPA: hypothetical protein VH084_22000 [Mycobacterium sp.]|nr:hypothetical protein [Mycobacterium sp.]
MSRYNDVRKSLGAAAQQWLGSIGVEQPAMNVYNYVPRTLIPPSVIIQPVAQRTLSYLDVLGQGNLADWYFHVLIVVGLVDEEAAQELMGDIISPGSSLIYALQECMRFVQVTDGSVAEMMFDGALHAYARINVKIKA